MTLIDLDWLVQTIFQSDLDGSSFLKVELRGAVAIVPFVNKVRMVSFSPKIVTA